MDFQCSFHIYIFQVTHLKKKQTFRKVVTIYLEPGTSEGCWWPDASPHCPRYIVFSYNLPLILPPTHGRWRTGKQFLQIRHDSEWKNNITSESFSWFPRKALCSHVDQSCTKCLAIESDSFKQSLSLSLMVMTLRGYSLAALQKVFPHS